MIPCDQIDLLLEDGMDEKEIAKETGWTVGHVQARKLKGERKRKAKQEHALFRRVTSNLLGKA